ncbi:MAG: hypothetical protein ACFHU9_07500 [Fluviicola sp.]
MNNVKLILLAVLLSGNAWSQNWFVPSGMTRIEVGYPHAGSYIKERPSFALEQSFLTILNPRFFAGVGTGFALYPGAYTVPVFIHGGCRFRIRNKFILWEHRIGANIRTGQNAFFGYRYNTTLSYSIPLSRKVILYAGLGANYLWDRWGGKSLSGAASASVLYTFKKTPKPESQPPEDRSNPPW